MDVLRRATIRWSQRILILGIALLALWIIITLIFIPLDTRLPLLLALFITYVLSAYVLLPRLVHFGLVLTRRGRIPRSTRAADGLTEGPVNLLLIGSEQELLAAFAAAGWHEADPLTLTSSWKMLTAFVRNKPYERAPFRPLYLFARSQDHGFQIPIGNSPRERHHVRFWGINYNADIIDSTGLVNQFAYWIQHQPIDPLKPMMWVGSGTKDTGIGLTKLTYQITHSVDAKNVDEEREFIFNSLHAANAVKDEHYVEPGAFVAGNYRSDGRIKTATLVRP
jgi:hypothetical protein